MIFKSSNNQPSRII